LGTSFWHGQSEGEASIGTSTETNDGGAAHGWALVRPNLIEIMVGQGKGGVPWTIIYIVNEYIVIVIFTN
jgi:hypothetical protein